MNAPSLQRNGFDFYELDEFRRYLEELNRGREASLKYFYKDDLTGFIHWVGDRDVSITSSAASVICLMRTREWWGESWRSSQSSIVKTLLVSKWESGGLSSDNPYTTAIVLEVLKEQESEASIKGEESKREKGLGRLLFALNAGDGGIAFSGHEKSTYLTNTVVRALISNKKLSDDVRTKVCNWARSAIEKQLALFVAGSKSADIYQLVYAVILVNQTSEAIDETPDQELLINAALRIFFESQSEDGTWPLGRPLFHYPDRGSAYCYDYEALSDLLHACESATKLREQVLQYFPKLKRAALALRYSSQQLAGGGAGWASRHFANSGGPEGWVTAYAYLFLHHLGRQVAELIRRALFTYVGAPYSWPPAQSDAAFRRFADCVLGESGSSLLAVIKEKLLIPVAAQSKNVKSGLKIDRRTPTTMVLYGPPGTSKTELSKKISEYLGWPHLVIDPTHVLRNGLDKVYSEAGSIFGMLAASEEIVVLVDEFDEMVRERGAAKEAFSRFLTTIMLPQLASINGSRKILFILATNHIENFDIAISRQGRFDMILQVMPPTAEAKRILWNLPIEALGRSGIIPDFEQKLEDLTYLECQGLVDAYNTNEPIEANCRRFEEVYDKCTLRTKVEGSDASVAASDWKAICKEQERHIRYVR